MVILATVVIHRNVLKEIIKLIYTKCLTVKSDGAANAEASITFPTFP